MDAQKASDETMRLELRVSPFLHPRLYSYLQNATSGFPQRMKARGIVSALEQLLEPTVAGASPRSTAMQPPVTSGVAAPAFVGNQEVSEPASPGTPTTNAPPANAMSLLSGLAIDDDFMAP